MGCSCHVSDASRPAAPTVELLVGSTMELCKLWQPHAESEPAVLSASAARLRVVERSLSLPAVLFAAQTGAIVPAHAASSSSSMAAAARRGKATSFAVCGVYKGTVSHAKKRQSEALACRKSRSLSHASKERGRGRQGKLEDTIVHRCPGQGGVGHATSTGPPPCACTLPGGGGAPHRRTVVAAAARSSSNNASAPAAACTRVGAGV